MAPTPVLLPGKSHGRRSLVGCSPWGHYELDTTEQLHFHFSLSCIGGENGNPLQYSCLENSRDRGAWWAAVYGVAQTWTQLKRLSNSSRAFYQLGCGVTNNKITSTSHLDSKLLVWCKSNCSFCLFKFAVWYCFCCFCSVAKSSLTLCNPMDCSMPGSPVLHFFLEFVQILILECILNKCGYVIYNLNAHFSFFFFLVMLLLAVDFIFILDWKI